MASFLSSIFEPGAREELVRLFPSSPFHQEGDAARIAGLFPPEVCDIHALARVFHDPVTAWFDDDAKYESTRAQPLRAPESLARYEAGALLQFNYVERWLPQIAPLLRSLELDLGIPPGTAHCQLFASKAGGGAKAHWDNDPVLTIQLRGSKSWRFSAQGFVAQPTYNYVCGTHRGPLAEYHEGELPQGMPAEAREVRLVPGAVLFLPRGYLHETRTHGHSLSLGFDFTMPTWSDLVWKHLRHRLNQNERWREYALGISDADISQPLQRLRGMLGDIQQVVDELIVDSEPVLRVADPPLHRSGARSFHRTNVRAELGRSAVSNGYPCRIEAQQPGDAPTELELSPELVELAQWIVEASGVLSQREILQHGASLERVDVIATLEAFIEVGVLVPETPRSSLASSAP